MNHLGNVLVTVSDKKKYNTTTNSYDADIVSASDYYPFGMQMPGRNLSAGGYRYGFNGKEKLTEYNSDNYDYGMRIYDSRIGKFLSVDPLTKDYPYLTPYQYASNRPIDGIDLDGKEYLKNIPKFENSGNRTWVDYVGAIDNGVINILNLVPSTWNSAVSTYQALKGGTWTKDISNEAGQMYGGIKQTAKQFYHEPIKTVTSPSAIEFAVSTYVGAKVFNIGGNSGNLIKPVTAAKIEETVTLYRGINESHIDWENALKGIVKPNGGNATAFEHNAVSTLKSPFTSWTTDLDVATNYALRPGGSGVVLKFKVPLSKTILSPNTKSVLLKQTGKVVSESEVLLKGKIKVPKANITNVTQPQ